MTAKYSELLRLKEESNLSNLNKVMGTGVTYDPIDIDKMLELINESNTTENRELTGFAKEIMDIPDDSNQIRDKIIHRNLNMLGETYLTNKEFMKNEIYKNFDRQYSVYPDIELTGLCHYIFMTRPDLNILNNSRLSAAEKIFDITRVNQPWIMDSLTVEGSHDHDFMSVITSRSEALQLPVYNIRTSTVSQMHTGYILPYASHGIASTTGGSFDLQLREFSDLSLHSLFDMWLTYVDLVTRGVCDPKEEYYKFNRCDYAVSLYDIICAPDARTILYWVKYVGAFPTADATDTISFNLRGRPDTTISIPFSFFRSEIKRVESLMDFNMNAHIDTASGFPEEMAYPRIGRGSVETTYQGYSIPLYGDGCGLVGKPFIKFNNRSGYFELCWANPN